MGIIKKLTNSCSIVLTSQIFSMKSFRSFFSLTVILGLIIISGGDIQAQIISDSTPDDEFNIEFLNKSIYEDADKDETGEQENLDEAAVKGSFRLNFGVEGDDFIWKESSYLWQEGSWRYLYGEKRYNTYDPAVYNQFKMTIDSPIDGKLSFYTKIVVDPWSFTGKSQKITLPSWYAGTDGNDPVEIQLKYWSNTGRTYPEIVRSEKGDSLALPEIKVVDGETQVAEAKGEWNKDLPSYHHIDIPELKIDTEFKPIKAFWFDYKEDLYRMVVFLYAEENITMYSDDPLCLVNNHIMWQPSPWLDKWKPGRLYTVEGWENGSWNQDLFLKDSASNRLTLLKALRLEGEFFDIYSNFMIASPFDPWDDYDTINNIPLAWRLKKDFTDQFMIGGVYSSRTGFNQDSLDALDQTVAIDSVYEFNEYHTLKTETAYSKIGHNLNNQDYKLYNDDFAYKILLESDVDPFEMPIISNLSFTYMGEDFVAPLSRYNYTRDDQLWGRHLSFYSRSPEEENYRIGNSIDVNREVSALDINFGEFEGFNTNFNFRNVNRATDNKFIENVLRNETDYRANEQFLTKFKYIFHNREKTDEGKNQDTVTVALGAKYDFTDWVSLEEIFERTNEYPEFPNRLYDWLTINPSAPYPYYYLNKVRLIFNLNDWMEIAFENTCNEFEYAATLDDFMNYSGTDIRFWFSERIYARTVYRYSRVADFSRNNKMIGHHNFYFDLAYDLKDEAKLVIQFSDLGDYVDGIGWQSAVLDTQHIVRLVYECKF
ncbi:MAG: hypothetical protein ABIG64_09960 [Candidatus Omnitrophota bacterium]